MNSFAVENFKPPCLKVVCLEDSGLIEVYTTGKHPGNIINLLLQLSFIDAVTVTANKTNDELSGKIIVKGNKEIHLSITRINEEDWLDIFWLHPDGANLKEVTLTKDFNEFKKLTGRIKIMIENKSKGDKDECE